MSRLTKRTTTGVEAVEPFETHTSIRDLLTIALDRLADYEDINDDPATLATDLAELAHYRELKAAGRLVELPCKVGDMVCEIQHPTQVLDKSNPVIVPMRVFKITLQRFEDGHEKMRIDVAYSNKFGENSFSFFLWGEDTVFTQLKEAEDRLAKIKEKRASDDKVI